MTSSHLTWAQQIVWTGQQIVPDGAHYNQAFCLDVTGPLNVDAMQQAFAALCSDVDALRLVFQPDGNGAIQSDSGSAPQLVRETFLDRDAAQAWMEAQALHPFNLATSCTRAALLEVSKTHHVIFMVQHHLVADGVSVSLLFEALSERYAAALGGAAPDPMAAFLATAPALIEASSNNAPDGTEPLSALPLYGLSPELAGTHKISVPMDLGVERLDALSALAATAEFRAFTPLMATQNILSTLVMAWLSRITAQSDVAFATPQHNRVSQNIRGTVGLFMEMLPLTTHVEPTDSFVGLHERVCAASRDLMIKGGPGTARVEQLRHRNVILNVFSGRPIAFDGLVAKAQIVPVAASDPAHDIVIEFADFEGTGAFEARMVFDASRFDADARKRALGHFLNLFDAFMADPNMRVADADILTGPEHQALQSFNARAHMPAPDGTVLDRFTAGLSDAPAVRDAKSGESLSHAELDRAANKLAHLLLERGARAGDFIAVNLPRSIETIIAILATHKIGAAFVPLEATLSKERRDFILKDTNAALVVSDKDLPNGVQVKESSAFPDTPVSAQTKPEAPAYVIYTSGSTGTPKGVVVGHAELLGYCEMCLSQYPLERGKSFAFFSAFGFDLTINSLFMPLMSGGEIVVYPEPESGGDIAILDVFSDDAVDIVKPTPSHLRLGILNATKPLNRITYLPHSGEAFPADLATQAHHVLGDHLVLINEYGPTEAVVGAMMHQFDPAKDTGPLVPLGTPAPGMRIFVVNEALAHQPFGVPGEIAIGGRLAQGYLNRDELTAEKFVSDPQNPGERLYLTGDLGVFGPHGELCYLGRMDDQIKLNGIRLELGEIEHAISQVPGVDATVAALKPGKAGGQVLVAYAQGQARRDAIASAALKALPASVQLSAIVALLELPLSSNGKIARSRLPEPSAADWLAKTGGRGAQTPHEHAIAEIWSEVLGLDRVGAEDDFYALGGDSLTAVRITHAARAKGYNIAPVDIFKARTIAALAAEVEHTHPVDRPAKRTRFSRMSGDAKAQLAKALRQK